MCVCPGNLRDGRRVLHIKANEPKKNPFATASGQNTGLGRLRLKVLHNVGDGVWLLMRYQSEFLAITAMSK